jgi:hypothetical protein
MDLHAVQDNGNIVFVKIVDNLDYNNLQLKEEENTKIQLQLACTNLKICNIFFCVLNDNLNINNYQKDETIDTNLFVQYTNNSTENNFKNKNKIYFSDNYIVKDYFITNIHRDDTFIRNIINKINDNRQINNNYKKRKLDNNYQINNNYKKIKLDDIDNDNIETDTELSNELDNDLDNDNIETDTELFTELDNDLDNNLDNDLDNELNNKLDNKSINTIIDRDWLQWVSASKVRNYLMKDPLLDWLNLRKNNLDKNIDLHIKNNIVYDGFTSYIMNKGIEFEDVVMVAINKKFKKCVKKIGESTDARKISKFRETIDAMKQGIPIIYQGILHNESNQTYGAPDLIVRSDYINKLVKDKVLTDIEEKIPAPGLGLNNYHYRIIDIKCCTLHLTADGIHILNSGSIYAYKGQLYIYNMALGEILGYMPNSTYIMGKRWNYTSCKQKYEGDNCFDKLGTINYEDFDSQYKEVTLEAIEWIKKLRKEGHNWSLFDENNNNRPTIDELYPNMSNYYDSPWRGVKEQVAEELKEITSLWQCGVNNRENAHSQNIYRWDDHRCNAKILGINGYKKAPILDELIKINRSDEIKITKKITNNDGNWQNESKLEFFVDFETISDICTDFNICSDNKVNCTGSNIIFMIGVGYKLDGLWNFITFLAKDNTLEEERIMIDRFYKYITTIKNKILGSDAPFPNLYHWGHAERTLFRSAKYRHHGNKWNNLNWFDMLDVFKKEPIVINGCLNFGLKNVAKAMYKHGFIKTVWRSDNPCSNGTNAMVFAYSEYEKYRLKNDKIKNSNIIREIAEYNEIDCKVIWEIINYLRNNSTFK